jgi:hypothetical protein
MEKTRNAYIILVGKPKAKDPLGELSVERRILLQEVLGRT